MIRECGGDDLRVFDAPDPFLTRIRSLSDAYGDAYDFLRFFIQEEAGKPVSALSLFASRMTVYLTDDSDLEEVCAFLSMNACSSVMADERFSLKLCGKSTISGEVLVFEQSAENAMNEPFFEPDLKDYYALLKRCEDETFLVPDELSFLSDVTHRKNLGKCLMLALPDDAERARNKPKSAAMTVSFEEKAAIIGAVATDPLSRGKGLGRKVVTALSQMLKTDGKNVYVFSAKEENTTFYQHCGFRVVTRFVETMLKS